MNALKNAEPAPRLVKEIDGLVCPRDVASHAIAPVYSWLKL